MDTAGRSPGVAISRKFHGVYHRTMRHRAETRRGPHSGPRDPLLQVLLSGVRTYSAAILMRMGHERGGLRSSARPAAAGL
eukprot:3877963-Prymnesium_polylepis.2